MSVHIRLTDSKFHIREANITPAFKVARCVPCRYYGGSSGKRWRTLFEVLEDWGYSAIVDDNEDICDIELESETLGDEYELFKALAPYVETGSYIELLGDGELWRWVFDGKTCREIRPKIVWEA